MYVSKAVLVAAVANVVDNGSGLCRVTTATPHGRTTGDVVYVASVAGATAANGRWVVTVIDGSTLDLQSSTFAGTYTSGGTVSLKQELRVAVTTTPTTPLQVVASVRYFNSLTGAIAGVDTIFATLPSTTEVIVLASHADYDTLVDSCSVYNADGSTRVVDWTISNYLTSGKVGRASLATTERGNLASRAAVAIYNSSGRLYEAV